MRRAQLLYPIVALPVLAVVGAALAQAAEPAPKVPAPVEARKDAVPVPEQKAAAPDSKTAADSGDKKDASKKGKKEKKPVVLAKTLFGAAKTPAPLAARAIGFYSKGCLAGGVQLPDAGPDWQTMRPSRNRAWGHPRMIKLLHRLADEAKENDGWPGLLVGDIAQPRGGPMLSGHASHQVGLDADVWLTPMPDRVLTVKEREDIQATMMVDKTRVSVDSTVFGDKQVALIKRAASYREVERIFVNPAIKKALCNAAGTDRKWLSKVRPIWGHDYHFHIRMGCTNGGCESQPRVDGDEGCGKGLDNWLKAIGAEAKKKQAEPPPKPDAKVVGASDLRKITMDQLPAECRTVLKSSEPTTIAGETKAADTTPTAVAGETKPADPAPAAAPATAAASTTAAEKK